MKLTRVSRYKKLKENLTYATISFQSLKRTERNRSILCAIREILAMWHSSLLDSRLVDFFDSSICAYDFNVDRVFIPIFSINAVGKCAGEPVAARYISTRSTTCREHERDSKLVYRYFKTVYPNLFFNTCRQVYRNC